MRSLCYSVAMSLDGFIAGSKGEYDWIIDDPTMGPKLGQDGVTPIANVRGHSVPEKAHGHTFNDS